jgi:hypothetical protein
MKQLACLAGLVLALALFPATAEAGGVQRVRTSSVERFRAPAFRQPAPQINLNVSTGVSGHYRQGAALAIGHGHGHNAAIILAPVLGVGGGYPAVIGPAQAYLGVGGYGYSGYRQGLNLAVGTGYCAPGGAGVPDPAAAQLAAEVARLRAQVQSLQAPMGPAR